jgi:hypothetical protein
VRSRGGQQGKQKKRIRIDLIFLCVLERKKTKQHADYIPPMLQFCMWIGYKKETLLAVPRRLQIKYVWILGVQEIVLFVLGDVLCLLPKFSLRLRVYSAHLDPQCAGVCPVYFG